MKAGLEYGSVIVLLGETPVSHRELLKRLLREKSLCRGKFLLSSGKTSDYYIDCKLTTLDPEGAALTAYTILELLDEKGIQADAIGGPVLGAVPIVAAVAAVSYLRANADRKGTPLPGFLVRKEPKGHGRQKQIEGLDLTKVRKVVIVDEVCTEGTSIEVALQAVEEQGLEVMAVISLVDREQGGHERLRAKYGDRYLQVFTAQELLQDEAQVVAQSPQASGKPL
jgi:orotate phosphoribosyltransferase